MANHVRRGVNLWMGAGDDTHPELWVVGRWTVGVAC
jgi:hypothetical protein